MAYQLTNATSIKDLLSKIVIFASAQGWTIDFDNSSGATGGVGGHIGLHSGNCHVCLGEQTATQNPVAVTDTFPNPDVVRQDGRIYGALSTSINPALQRYWGQPGSLVPTATDGNRVWINNLYPSSDEVHFFGNSEYVWCVLRVNVDQWTSFGFGLLDTKGMTVPKPAFLMGMYHEWWRGGDQVNGIGYKAYMGIGHVLYQFGHTFAGHIRVPPGVLDVAYGFTATDQIRPLSQIDMGGVTASYFDGQKYTDNFGQSSILDMWGQYRNTPTTGGVPLFSCPLMFKLTNAGTNVLETYLGDLPGYRVCDISDVPIGEGMIYGSVEEWLPFPVKRRTPWYQNTAQAAAAFALENQPSTYGFGVAFLKED